MTTDEFFKRFPDEATCIQHMKEQREKAGIRCRSCDSSRLSWRSSCNRLECLDCKVKTTIRSGTFMMDSKLSIDIWYTFMFLMTSTPKAVSAKDMQQRLGMQRSEPVWYMMQKIRRAMDRANESVQLTGVVEIDVRYFTSHKAPEPGDELFNRGRGSVRKQPMLVTVESREGAKGKSAGRLRMEHLPDHKGATYSACAQRLLQPGAVVMTDANPVYKAIAPHVKAHLGQKSTPQEASNALPWVHTAISNAERLFSGIFHHLSCVWLSASPI